MSLELHPNDVSQTDALWRTWETGINVELEATFKTLDLTSWLNVVQHLRSLGLREDPQPTKLNIMVGGGLRFTLVGEGVIQQFCKDNTLIGKPFHVMLKEKKRSEGSEGRTEVDWKEYGVRVKLRRELPLAVDDSRVRDALARWASSPKSFRLIKRYSFSSLQHKGIQFDLSLVRHNRKTARGDYIQASTFTSAEIGKQPIAYEVEVEAVQGATKQSLYIGIATILRGIQKSFTLIRESVKQEVLDLVSRQTGVTSNTFPGAQPVTLERPNVLPTETDIPNIRLQDYNVTDKADGQRCLLVVDRLGRVFLVDTNLNVYSTDRRLPAALAKEWAGAILDGEWVRRNAENKPISSYYAFDVFNGENGEDVTQRPFIVRGAPDAMVVSRNAVLAKFTGILSNADRTVVGIPSHQSLSIHMKTFHTPANPADPSGIFRDAASILDRLKENPPYHTDGLIFTPNTDPLPKQGTWINQFKWKPAEENTIDFLVVTEKERDLDGAPTGTELVASKYQEDTNQVVRYKTLRLFVGSSTDPALVDPRDTILNNKPLPKSLDRGEYRPVEFKPQPPDPMASVCYVAINAGATDPAGATIAARDIEAMNDTIRCTRSGDPITSNSIVEMAYHPHKPAGWRWEPIRVRWDKTERFQKRIISRTLNSENVANSIWSSIHTPVTEFMIRTGALEESADEAAVVVAPKAYYIRKAPARDQYSVRGLRSFHNQYIKDDILLSRVIKPGSAVYDMSCGEAGDMHKWHNHRAGWVLGTDIAEKGLTDNQNGAYRRYLDQIVRNNGKYTPMLFVCADSSQRLLDGGAGQTPMDRSILRCLWGAKEADVPEYVDKFRGKAAEGFDTVSCMFAAHYFFKDRPTLDGWLRNISETLKVGGYFVGCCFDGEAVANMLKDKPVGGVVRGVDGDVDVWSITKRYDDVDLPATDDGLGKAIDVTFISIGETYTEYLMSWDYLQQRMSEIGCELLNTDEQAELGLRSSSNRFSESYEMAFKAGRVFNMTPKIKEFSFLNRWFIFRRRAGGTEPLPYTHVPKSAPVPVPVPVAPQPLPEPEQEVEVDTTPSNVPEIVEVEDIPFAPDEPQMKIEEVEAEDLEEAEAEVDAEEEKSAEKATGPIYKFYQKSEMKDDIGLKDKGWRRWLSTYALFPLHDLSDSSVVYPSMEAAFAAAKFKLASNKPNLGPTMFNELGEIHQKYARTRLEKGALAEKEDYALMEDEGDEIRKAARATEMKKVGAKLNEDAWNAAVDEMVLAYVKQRYDADERYRTILDKLKELKAHILFFTTAKGNEFSGFVNDDGEIEGNNALGRAMMKVIGLYY